MKDQLTSTLLEEWHRALYDVGQRAAANGIKFHVDTFEWDFENKLPKMTLRYGDHVLDCEPLEILRWVYPRLRVLPRGEPVSRMKEYPTNHTTPTTLLSRILVDACTP